jgi:branched-chain amino acid transport system ATP-binding protein
MLNVSSLDAYYGRLQVLRQVSLEVNEGELVTLIGANGAGKTTLLMCVCGIVRQNSGTIEFMGKRINRLPPHVIVGLGIIQVPQGRLLFPEMTVAENLELGAHRAGNGRNKKLEQKFEEVYGLFEMLGQRKNQRAGTLSGGEQQMLAIGRALMGDPKLLVLDEPSFGLAPIMVEMLANVIGDLHSKGLPILLVEQNAHLALELADRGYVLQSGSIVASGRASELAESEVVKAAYLGA